jgi:hypothetical protein
LATKRCTRCNIEKPLTEFHKQPGGRLGVHPHCRDCVNAAGRERRRARKAGNLLPRRRHGPLEPLPETKVCSKCRVAKPLSAYGKQTGGRFGLHPTCKECRRASSRAHYGENREAILVKQKEQWPRKRDGYRKRRREQRYGVTAEQYEAMYEGQGGRCAICGGEFDVLCVDHDHDTGAVRGLLCRPCNVGIGYLRDDPDRVEAAAGYLRAPPGVPS